MRKTAFDSIFAYIEKVGIKYKEEDLFKALKEDFDYHYEDFDQYDDSFKRDFADRCFYEVIEKFPKLNSKYFLENWQNVWLKHINKTKEN